MVKVTQLKIARLKSGLLQYEVAAKLGLSGPSYCNAENGRTRLSEKDAVKASRILKVPVDEISGGDES